MKKDIRCPICGKLNKNLILEETDGLFECECCNNIIDTNKMKAESIIGSIITLKQLKVDTVGVKSM